MKKILFTSVLPFHPQKGGVERVTDTLCKNLLKQGYNIFYLHCKWGSEDRKNYHYPVPTYVLPSQYIYDNNNINFYHDFLADKKIDIVIHQDALYESAYLFLNTNNLNIKKIAVLHSNPLLNYDYLWEIISQLKNNTIIEKFKRIARCILYHKIKREEWQRKLIHYDFLLKNSDKIVILSPLYASAIKRINPILIDKTIAIYNPNTYHVQSTIPEKSKEIIYVGRLCERTKKISRLLKIWRNLYPNQPDWKLKIIGDGEDRDHLLSISNKLHLKNIEFTGFKDPEQYYKNADIICMTSDFEGFPMTLTEAMQFGCVPIAFDSFDAVKDIIIPGVTGDLVKPFKLNEYTEKLSRLMNDNDYRKRLSINSFEYVNKFDVEKIINEWIKLIESI